MTTRSYRESTEPRASVGEIVVWSVIGAVTLWALLVLACAMEPDPTPTCATESRP